MDHVIHVVVGMMCVFKQKFLFDERKRLPFIVVISVQFYLILIIIEQINPGFTIRMSKVSCSVLLSNIRLWVKMAEQHLIVDVININLLIKKNLKCIKIIFENDLIT